jgi:conjugative relaxase-like TrwC/TraI family protein
VNSVGIFFLLQKNRRQNIMLAEPKVVSSSRARNYFEEDTYYLNNEFEQGRFYGKLKEELGLKEFNLKDFDAILQARHPRTGEQLLRLTKKDLDENGDRVKAACDLTFAADKSVSILYEISDEETKAQIREAFTRSIDKSLDFAEANYAKVKDRNNRAGKEGSGKMIFARFDHSESRNNDMHLHQHALAINMTQDANGQWRAMEYHDIMHFHQFLGQIQRNEFAKELQALGFEVELIDAKQGTFKLKNIEEDLRQTFSTRSQDIKEEMKESGQTSYKATHTAQKQTAKWKDKNKDREAIQEENIVRLKEAGADLDAIKATNPEQEIRTVSAKDAIETAFIDTTDLNSVFTREDILKHALKVSLTTQGASLEELEKAFDEYKHLVTLDEKNNHYTTSEVLFKERAIFEKKHDVTFSVQNDKAVIDKAIKAFEKQEGFELKEGQNDLAHTILSSNKQFIVAQGVAGAGKSTSLEIVRNVCEEQGRRIVALAPTGTATDNLAKEAKIEESYTVAKFLQTKGAGIKDAVVIVDEAGMMGLRDTYSLAKIAQENNLKVIFSGDKNQKKSISQGDIFAGMQRQGFETVILNEGNRQKTDQMKQAVEQILDKDLVAAMHTLKDTTNEITDHEARLQAAQEEYLKDMENSLLITSTNVDRHLLNASIRSVLKERGEIIAAQDFDSREIPSFSSIEKRSALYYKAGENVYLSKNIGSISAGREAKIMAVDLEANTVTIEHKGAKKTFTEIVDLTQRGADLNLFREVKINLGVGDKIIAKKNDRALKLQNGQMGKITGIDGNTFTIDFNGKEKKVDIAMYPYISHAYAITDFASQGKTTDKVIAIVNSNVAGLNDFYTQITRAKYAAHIFTDNLEDLTKRAAQESVKLNATEILYQNKGIKNGKTAYSPGQLKRALYESSDRELGGGAKTDRRDDLRVLSEIDLAHDAKKSDVLLHPDASALMDIGATRAAAYSVRRSRDGNTRNDGRGGINKMENDVRATEKQITDDLNASEELGHLFKFSLLSSVFRQIKEDIALLKNKQIDIEELINRFDEKLSALESQLKQSADKAKESLKEETTETRQAATTDIEKLADLLQQRITALEAIVKENLESLKQTQEPQKAMSEEQAQTPQRAKRERLSDDQISQLKQRTRDELRLSDPESVLSAMGVEYKAIGQDSYQLKTRDEKTPSSFISLRNGEWKYKDFGTGKGGDLVTLVMDVTGKEYKEALSYTLQNLGLKNHLEEALQMKSQEYSLSKAEEARINKLKEDNKAMERSATVSKVTATSEVQTNAAAMDYLRSRGIEKVPPGMQIIKGEYVNRDGEIKEAYGVGILTQNGGADIHFLKKLGNLKTMTFGEKDISFLPNTNSDKVAIFESKMDYAAAYQQMDLSQVNVVIANSVTNADKVVNLLNKEGLNKEVMIFNQNDKAGARFADTIAKNVDSAKAIEYANGEEKKDVNDLHIDDVQLKDRIVEYVASELKQEATQAPAQTKTNEEILSQGKFKKVIEAAAGKNQTQTQEKSR